MFYRKARRIKELESQLEKLNESHGTLTERHEEGEEALADLSDNHALMGAEYTTLIGEHGKALNRLENLKDIHKMDLSNISAMASEIIAYSRQIGYKSIVTHATTTLPMVVRAFSLHPGNGTIMAKCEVYKVDEEGIKNKFITIPADELSKIADLPGGKIAQD